MIEMNYKIEKKETFNIIGFMDTFSCIEGCEDYESIIQKWANLSEHKMQQLYPLMNGYIQAFIGASNTIDNNYFQYTIAVTSDLLESKELDVITLPEMNWLILSCTGAISNKQDDSSFGTNSSAMVKLKKHVLGGWLEEQGLVHAKYPRIEVYYQGDMTSDDYESELWIPII